MIHHQQQLQALPRMLFRPSHKMRGTITRAAIGSAHLGRRFHEVLSPAKNEKPLQLLFEQYPIILLTSIVCHRTSWVFARQSLPKPEGGSWVPDFMICDWT
jgi:hypothetical protein